MPSNAAGLPKKFQLSVLSPFPLMSLVASLTFHGSALCTLTTELSLQPSSI